MFQAAAFQITVIATITLPSCRYRERDYDRREGERSSRRRRSRSRSRERWDFFYRKCCQKEYPGREAIAIGGIEVIAMGEKFI